ncbi:Naa50 [Scenedesmus sp. PABB004]|nr:Naa50 [Scenedesmus sp. PABB004]
MSRSAPPAAEPIALRPLSREHLPALKTLNAVVFPLKLHDQVYRDALACGPVSQLAFEGDTLVGAIACRLEALPQGGARLYIASLAVLAPYRGCGLGSRLLAASLAECADDGAIREAVLHVHAANEEAREFYERRGFAVRRALPRPAGRPAAPGRARRAVAACAARLTPCWRWRRQVREVIRGYYKRLEPPDAVLLARQLHPAE